MAIADFDGGLDSSKQAAPVAALPTSTDYDNVNKMGSTNPIQYTEPKPEPNIVQRVGEDIEKPFVQAQHTVGAGISWLGDNLKDETSFGALGDRVTRAGLILQERANASLSKKFSNFTPNILDQVVGAAPSLAAFIGVASLGAVPAAVATVGTAGTLGAGIAAEDFAKFKAKGQSTPEADARALAIGIPSGTVAALGFGVANKLVSPWLGQVLGDTIRKIASTSVQGGTALMAQAVTSGEAETALGVRENTKENQINIMKEAATNVVLGGLLGPVSAVGHVFDWHNQVANGFKKLGVPPKDAEQATTDMLGQASHVVMDQIEGHIKPTPDELGRIQATPNPTAPPPRPNILDRKNIPQIESEYPSLGQEKTPDDVVEMSRANEYVKLEPLDLQVKDTEKATAQDIRERWTGGRDKQLARGTYLHDDMTNAAPQETDGEFWGINHSENELQFMLNNPEGYIKTQQKVLSERFLAENKGADPDQFKFTKEEFDNAVSELKSHSDDIKQALNLSEGAKQAISMASRYFEEAKNVATALGTIHEGLDNYRSNRLYKNDPVKIGGASGLKQFSSHSLQRIYDSPGQAIAGGKRLATTNLPDLVAIHNQELTGVNYGRQLADELSKFDQTPLGKWVAQNSMPKDWKQVGELKKDKLFIDKDGNPQMSRYVFGAPKGIADGLKPLVDPDWLRAKIPGVASIQDMQAYVKTGWLGLSVFHDITFATQTASSIGGPKTLADLPKAIIDGTMDTPAWREKELFALNHNLTTTTTHEVQDIRSQLEEKGEGWNKFLKIPAVKQLNDISEAHTKFLFGPYQRWIKVETFSKEYANWEGKHASATEEEARQAGIGIAQATNAEFGGRNWEALGVSKTTQSLLRTFLLAPDWVMSMVDATKFAAQGIVGQGGTAGVQARGTLFKAVAGGLAVADGLNYLMNGHHLWENPKGHKTEVQLAPDVYFSPVRGAPGELLKLVSNAIESGPIEGLQRYVEGKASPFLGTGVMALTGSSYTGGSIWRGNSMLEKQINGIWALVSHNIPIPLGLTGAVNYAQRENQQTPMGWGSVLSGTGRFSKPSVSRETSNMNESVIQAYRNGNDAYVKGLIDKGDLSEEEADHLKDESLKTDLERKTEHLKVDKLIELYNHSSTSDRQQMRDTLEDKFGRYMDSSASPNAKKKVQKLYDNMAKE